MTERCMVTAGPSSAPRSSAADASWPAAEYFSGAAFLPERADVSWPAAEEYCGAALFPGRPFFALPFRSVTEAEMHPVSGGQDHGRRPKSIHAGWLVAAAHITQSLSDEMLHEPRQ